MPVSPFSNEAWSGAFTGEKLAEGELSLLWYSVGFARPGLRTRCGRRVRILYRGLPNGERGPDYLGAALSWGRGKPRCGDIELHLRTSQWRAHGHQRDPHYQGVILHVVWQDDDPRPTLLPNGRQVPVLVLGAQTGKEGVLIPRTVGSCLQRADPDRAWLGEVLDRAGEDRFLGKAARLEGEMAALPAQEVLYQALALALGYSQNKEPFQRLAASLPLGVLEGFLWGKDPGRQEVVAQALLLGMAGLLPSQRGLGAGSPWGGLLEEAWRSYGLGPSLGPEAWRLGVRPENHPARRLAGLASLVVRSLEPGLLPWLLGPLAPPRSPAWWGRLVQEAGGYWRDHFDLRRPGLPLGPSLIGRGRALEMAINALLPFAYAYGQVRGDSSLSLEALEAYSLLPSPGPNRVTRHMGRQLLGASSALAASAQRQQGLLHLFRSFCTQGKCRACPLASG